MADGIDIDWGALTQGRPDLVGGAVNAFKVGQDLGRSSALINANAMYAQNPAAGIQAATAFDPAYGAQLQGIQNAQADRQSTIDQATAVGQGDLPAAITAAAARGATGDASTLKAQLDAVPAQQKAQAIADAQTKNEQLAHVLIGLLAYPVEQRLGIARHMAQTTGLADPATISANDVTDAGIQAHMATTMSIEQFLKQQDTQRTADLAARKETFDETKPVYHFGQPGEAATLESGNPNANGSPVTGSPASNIPTGPVADQIIAEAHRQNVDPNLALSIAFNGEGNGRFLGPNATSPKGAIGTMQLMPQTAKGLGVDPTNPADNIRGGVTYIAQLAQKYGGDPAKVAAAYNAGPGAVDQAGGVPNFPETQAYVNRVAPAASAAGSTAGGLPTRVGQTTIIGGAADAPFDPSAKGGDINSIPAADRGFVQALIDGRYPAPTGYALKDPNIQRYVREATQVDPGFDATKYGERQKLYNAATSGPIAQQMLQLMKTAGHLKLLSDAGDALHNGTTQFGNDTINYVRQSMGDPAVTHFNTTRDNVAEEVDKLMKGGASDVAGTKRAINDLSYADSPAQLHAAIGALADLIKDQMDAQQQRWSTGMGGRAASFATVTPGVAQTLAILGSIGRNPPSRTGGGAPQRPAAPASSSHVAPTGAGHMSEAQIRAQLGL